MDMAQAQRHLENAETDYMPGGELLLNNIMHWYRGERQPAEIWQDYRRLNHKYANNIEMDDLEKRRWSWYERAARTGTVDGQAVEADPSGQLHMVDPIDPMPGSFWPNGVSQIPMQNYADPMTTAQTMPSQYNQAMPPFLRTA